MIEVGDYKIVQGVMRFGAVLFLRVVKLDLCILAGELYNPSVSVSPSLSSSWPTLLDLDNA